MNFPATHPDWVWLYFGSLASVQIILFTIISWNLMTLSARLTGGLRSAARWAMFGAMFLLFALWFACGIGGPPGNLLSPDSSTHSQPFAWNAALGSAFFGVPGWACLLVALRKVRGALSEGS